MTKEKIYIWTSMIPMATRLGRVVTYGRKISHTMLRDLLITWSREKYNTLYLHFCSIYDHKIGQNSNLQWGNPTCKVTWPFDYVVTWQMKKTYIYTYTIPIATKLGTVKTYNGEIPSTNSRNLLITWTRKK